MKITTQKQKKLEEFAEKLASRDGHYGQGIMIDNSVKNSLLSELRDSQFFVKDRVSAIRDLKNKYPSMLIKDIAEMYDSIVDIRESQITVDEQRKIEEAAKKYADDFWGENYITENKNYNIAGFKAGAEFALSELRKPSEPTCVLTGESAEHFIEKAESAKPTVDFSEQVETCKKILGKSEICGLYPYLCIEQAIQYEKMEALGINVNCCTFEQCVNAVIDIAEKGRVKPDRKLVKEILDIFDDLLDLLERANDLIGNPGTNISSSCDIACDKWRDDYNKFKNSENDENSN